MCFFQAVLYYVSRFNFGCVSLKKYYTIWPLLSRDIALYLDTSLYLILYHIDHICHLLIYHQYRIIRLYLYSDKIISTSNPLMSSSSPCWPRLLFKSTIFSTSRNNHYFILYGKTKNSFIPQFHNILFIIYTSSLCISYIQTSLNPYTS